MLESNGSFSKGYSYAKDKSGKIYSDEQYTLNGLNYRTRRLYDVADRNNYIQTFRSDVSYPVYTLSYSFDSKGRLYMFSNQSASEYSSGGDYDIYYTYDKNDNIKTGKTRAGVTTEYNYNDANMLTSLVNKKDSTTYSTYSYNYNLDGNINRKVESGKATDYVYDGTGRLSNEKITNGSAVTNMTYAYDNAGNRSSLTVTGTENYVTTYSYDKNNRLLKDSKKNNGASYADVTLYSYDNNGNQIRKDQSRDDLTGKPKMGFYLATANSGYGYEKFTYNGFNQLTAFEDEAGNKATYEYYSDGLRLSKTVNGAKSSYIWADNDLAMEIKSDEVISYAKAPGYMRTGSSKDRTYRNDKLYLFNGHGDVTSMIDKSGNVTKTYSYDAFGNELNRDKNDTNPFRYCGEYWDNETESIYLRARYYNPSIGRFTTEDPIKDGSNWYAYCGGNPVVFADANGLEYLVISGGQYNYKKTEYKYEFIEPAIKNLIAFKNRNDGESITWIIANEGWTFDEMCNFKYVADEIIGCSLIFINDKEKLFDYINTKGDNSRYKDPIHAISVFSHGFENDGGTIALGYNYDDLNYNKNLNINSDDIKNSIYKTAFDNPDSWFGCCNLGNNTKDSFAQNWVNKFKGRTWAFNGKSDYAKIVGRFDVKEKNARKQRGYANIVFGFSCIGSANYPVADKGAKFHEFYAAW